MPFTTSVRFYFYPRPLRGGRHQPFFYELIQRIISIHALREEGDTGTTDKPAPYEDFYPRPPRGGRRKRTLQEVAQYIFLSTPSARRATYFDFIRKSLFSFLSTPSARRATSRGVVSILSG